MTRAEVELLALDPELEGIHCSSPVEPNTWDLLNEILFANRPEIELRVYGFYGSVCDLSFLNRLANVRRFSADRLMNATGINHLAHLQKLDELSVGIYNLESFDFLELIPSGIKSLSLASTKSKKPRLDRLARFHSLTKLYLEAQQQSIEVVSELPTLEDITLRSISTNNLAYVSGLPRLWSLDIKLGGVRDFSSIEGKQSIKYLELWQVRELADIGFVSTLGGLQFLFLQSLRNVRTIPDLSMLSKLRRLYLENMKGLIHVNAIAGAPALEELIHVSARNVGPEKYQELLQMPTLNSLSVGFGSHKKNLDFEKLITSSGKKIYEHSEFVFQ